MNTVVKKLTAEPVKEAPLVISAVSALEKESGWINASDEERRVLTRIAMQRDRLAAARQAHLQTQSLSKPVETVPVDAPLAERLAIFAKLHPVVTAAVTGAAMMIGPRRLIRYGSLAWPLISRLKR